MASPTGQTGQGVYPRQIVIMVTHEIADRLDAEAKRHRLSKSEVTRTYIEAGIDVADQALAAASAPPLAWTLNQTEAAKRQEAELAAAGYFYDEADLPD